MNNSTLTLIGYCVIIFGIMYFLMIRPQQKQQRQRQAMINSLRVRDKVITTGGMYGKITRVKDNSVIMQIADKVEVEVAKTGIISVENRDVTAETNKQNNDKAKPEKAETTAKAEETPTNDSE
ncbi:MAG: preprotein translocase subunit YajC [Desulfitobacteriaceae bacterium]|nr:preprotein translocase subunit YajC [Desulfitobacteriaceae bacterium]MDD4346996.1 preprotein translocase subunit YajC [Desulfitobacteriaceae bacterium]MDD4402086.1 preprotein translocase subunit YajC [Desulfitobacteriaceae bacterium]